MSWESDRWIGCCRSFGHVLGRGNVTVDSLAADCFGSTELNTKKTVFIPLRPFVSALSVTSMIREHCSMWSDFIVADRGKYLGFVVGPGAGYKSWDSALAKYDQRVRFWAAKGLGLFMTTSAYKIYIHSVLGFPAQLCSPPPDLLSRFQAALRRLVPGPGKWIPDRDLVNLKQLGFYNEFVHPVWMIMAAQLRVSQLCVANVHDMHQKLLVIQSDHFRRQLGEWHSRCLASTLYANESYLRKLNITRASVIAEIGDVKRNLNEKVVTFLGRITYQKGPEYFIEAAYKILKYDRNIRFVMAGSGDMLKKMI